MKKILRLILRVPMLAIGKENKGIKFERNLSWEQVKIKAKSEHKYIFVDMVKKNRVFISSNTKSKVCLGKLG